MTELEIKAAVRERDGYRCTECGMTRTAHFAKYRRDLDTHRITPGSEYTLEGCITVCRACHALLPKADHNTDGPPGCDNLNVWLPEDVMRAFEELREEDARTKTAQVLVIFKDYLRRRGKWPPP